MNKKTIYLLLLVVVLIIIAGVLLYFLGPQGLKRGPEINSQGLSATEEEKDQAGPAGEVMVANSETGEEEPLKTATMPPALFNAQGTIVKLYDNGLTMKTAGYSFADGQSREVNVLYADVTVTTMADRSSKYKGLVGLSHLRVGQQIIVESDENIRGKLKFRANYINLLP
jgi:hypothetical protein